MPEPASTWRAILASAASTEHVMSGASEVALVVSISFAIVASFLLRVGYLGAPEPAVRRRWLACGWALLAVAVLAALLVLPLRDDVAVD